VDCDAVFGVPEGKYEILLIAEDEDKCKVSNADTVSLRLNILPPINHAPEILVNSETIADTIRIDAGQLLDLEILSFDLDEDSISVRILNQDNADELGVAFNASSGIGNVYSSFQWQTDCSLLGENFSDATYDFTMIVNDFKCLVPKSDTLFLTVVVHDEKIEYDILPPNVFTPNADDDINESYFIPDLPGDNCRRQFVEVVIVNRYGKEVFSSDQRDFKWYAYDHPPGVYYFFVAYSDFSFRGTISLLK
jgi:hypothetical protein